MKVIIPHTLTQSDLYEQNMASGAQDEWEDDVEYSIGNQVKVTTEFPEMVYKSLRSVNEDHSPPDSLEPDTINSHTVHNATTHANTTSIASLEIATGAKIVTVVGTGLAYPVTSMVKVARTENTAMYYMIGSVVSMVGTSLVLNVTEADGEGTFNNWTVTFLGTAIGSGEKRVFIEPGLDLKAGTMIKLTHPTTPVSRNISGEVEAYNATTGSLWFVATSSAGSGNFRDWNFEVEDESGWWEEVGAVNRHRMFDDYVNTATTYANKIEFVLEVDDNDSAALFGVTGDFLHVEWWDRDEYVRDDFSGTGREKISPSPRTEGRYGFACAYSPCGNYFAVTEPGLFAAGKVFIYAVTDFETETLYATLSPDNLTTPQAAALAGQVVTVGGTVVTLSEDIDLDSSFFGASVALSTDAEYVFVGDTQIMNPLVPPGEGAVYVFKRTAGTTDYTLHQTITLGNFGQSSSHFGASLALAEGGTVPRLFVGQPKYTDTNTNEGRVAVFSEIGSAPGYYLFERGLEDTRTAAGRLAGSSVATNHDGSIVAVGCPGDTGGSANNSGVVRIWRGLPGTPTIDAELYGYQVDNNARTGAAVAMSPDGEWLAIGSSTETVSGSNVGAARVYRRDAGSYELGDTVNTTSTTTKYYGAALAFAPDARSLLVGEYAGDGKIYHYSYPVPYYSETVMVDSPDDIVVIAPAAYDDAYLKVSLTAATGNVEIGNFVTGKSFDIGCTSYGIVVGILDYSLKETDDEGRTKVTQGYWSKKQEAMVNVDNDRLDTVYKTLADLRGTKTAWVGNNDNSSWGSLIVFGYYNEFSVTVYSPNYSTCALSVMGLT